ncbi:MAG: hypothetical protein KDI11_09840 [Alphaproteobacteria bacterium]|nr:hypothetical protein [Alphaproteobacteria bacterium]
MKRIYHKRKSKKLREDTLQQLQKTRTHFEEEYPELLEKARKALKQTGQTPKSEGVNIADETVDRKKTLEVILKYASTRTGKQKDNLKQELSKFLN